ncbi:kinase-like domain-containing protein [Hysterangium stoloniferum]|nr:kinase-like domain-containing protein [Hysterangium stoloniferum]
MIVTATVIERVIFVVVNGPNLQDHHFVDIDVMKLGGKSIGEWWADLINRDFLSDKDVKKGELTLQLRLHEDVPTASHISEDGLNTIGGMNYNKKLVQAYGSRSLGTKHKMTASENEKDAPKSAYPSKRYTSAYVSRYATINVAYIAYKLQKTKITVNRRTCDIEVMRNDEIETVLVQNNWREHIVCGGWRGGYLGHGLYKYAFEGKIQEKNFALFEWKEVCCQFNSENFNKLQSELVLLAWGKYFVKSFNECIRSMNAENIPALRWNTEDTFIGNLIDEVEDTTNFSESCEPTIHWNAFLAVPLLPKPTRKVKFSGNTEAGNNMNRLGMYVDAFAHHTVIDSVGEFIFADLQGFIYVNNTVVLFDPQAHSFNQTSGSWDKGTSAIQNFLNTHQCNDICHILELDCIRVKVPPPPTPKRDMNPHKLSMTPPWGSPAIENVISPVCKEAVQQAVTN